MTETTRRLIVSSKSDIIILKACAALPGISAGFKKQIWLRIDLAIDAVGAAEREEATHADPK